MSTTVRCADEELTVERVFCIGRNYARHAAELKNEVPDTPVVFMKPATSVVGPGERIVFPSHGDELHHEAEVVVCVGRPGRLSDPAEAAHWLAGVGLGIDLTLRDVQRELKAASLPWERAKAFDQSALCGELVMATGLDLASLEFTCSVDGEVRQRGSTADMLFPIARILVELSTIWSLRRGDLVFTGTPAGVGPLEPGDTVALDADWCHPASWHIGEDRL